MYHDANRYEVIRACIIMPTGKQPTDLSEYIVKQGIDTSLSQPKSVLCRQQLVVNIMMPTCIMMQTCRACSMIPRGRA